MKAGDLGVTRMAMATSLFDIVFERSLKMQAKNGRKIYLNKIKGARQEWDIIDIVWLP